MQNMLATLDSQRVLAMMTEFDEKKERQESAVQVSEDIHEDGAADIHVHPCYP